MKNLAHVLLALIFSLGSMNTQAQILIQEDFNNGFPVGWQSQSLLGPNQWNTTDNGGNNIDGTDMMMIQSIPGEPTLTELILPPFPPAPPGIIDILMEFEINLVSVQNMVFKVIQIDDQNPAVPIELVSLNLTSCDPITPWNCPNPFVVSLPLNNYDPQDQYIYVCEDLSGSGLDFCAIDNFVLIANPCPIGLILDTNFPPTCHNGADGLIQVTGILGVPPYTYALDFGPAQASDTFNTTPGPHTVTVVDAIGCTTTINVVVPNKADLVYNYVAAAPSCFDGNDATIIGAATGGTPGYTYTIDGGPAQGNGNFTTTPGVHNILVTDAVGCTKLFALTVPNADPIGIQQTVFPPTCHDGNDGQISVTASGGTPPYTYALDFGAAQGNGTFLGLIADPYFVTVVDANGCTEDFLITVPNATEIIFNHAAASPTCFNGNDGAIVGTAAGGTPPYTYALDFGPAQGNGTFLGLIPDPYFVTVVDANGCSKDFLIIVPNAPSIGIQQTVFAPTCHDGNDGQINATASGGTPPYSYSLDGGAAQGNGSFLTTPGVHTVTVTDANGCTNNFTITVPNSTNEIIYSFAAGSPTCFNGNDGAIAGVAAGGTPPYSYSLNFGPAQGNGTFLGLSPGFHTITITGALGCQVTYFIEVPNVPEMIVNLVHSASVSCNGGADAIIQVTGVINGTAPYAYTLNGVAGGPTWLAAPAGAYVLVVTDANGCTKTENFTIIQPPLLTIGAVLNHVSCSGAADGIITPFPGGGTPPYETRLDGGAFGAPVNYTDLIPGLYTLDVKDANACTATTTATITQPLPLVSDTASVTASSGVDGAIDVETNGGNPPYFYLWSNGEITQDIDSLPPGEYYVLTTDINGCPSDTLFVTVPSTIDPTACVAENFTDAPTGLFEDQTVAGGTKTQLKWNHYGEATTGCIIKGGTIGTMDVNAPYTQSPGQVLVQGAKVQGDINGHDISAQLAPNATFTLFNANTFPAGPTGAMVAGAFYKWQVKCGCIIDPTLPFPDRLANSNVHISPWSDFDLFTNLTPVVEGGNNTSFSFNEKSSISLYPNPSQGSFNILFKDLEDGMVQIDIRNILGEIVHSSSENISHNNQIMEIDLTNQTAGMYIIQIDQNSNVISSKMIIE